MRSLLAWLRGTGKHRARRTDQPPPPVSAEETSEALRCGEQALADAHARAHEVRSLARKLRIQREENHFGPLIEQALREGR